MPESILKHVFFKEYIYTCLRMCNSSFGFVLHMFYMCKTLVFWFYTWLHMATHPYTSLHMPTHAYTCLHMATHAYTCIHISTSLKKDLRSPVVWP